MTQNNSLLPEGYRFWSDDSVSEVGGKPDGETISKSSELEPISVQVPNLENAVGAQESADPPDFKFDDSSTAPNAVLNDLWLKSLGQLENSSQLSHIEPSPYWRCDHSGAVIWFLDQNGTAWSKNSEQNDLFFSEDGGERAANVFLNADGCSVEDSDGTTLNISFAGTFSILNRTKSREENIRGLMDVFCAVDANHDERLSLTEIETALNKCSEKDRPLINTLKTHYKRISWSRRGMFGQAADGLSLRDIIDLRSGGPRTSTDDINETLLAQIEAIIDFVDPKRSGFIQHHGLEYALSNLVMPARLRRSIELLIRRLKELSLFQTYGFSVNEWQPTRQDVRWMLCDLFKQTSSETAVDMPVWASFELCSGIGQELYASKNDPTSSITLDAIKNVPEAHQTFMATVAAAIAHCPELVLQTIRKSDNGAFVVTFIGDRNTPIRVLAPAQKDIHDYGLADGYGVWALILARGFAQYMEQNALSRKPFYSINEIVHLFLGKEIYSLALKGQCTNELALLIDQLWAQDRALILSRFPGGDQNVSTSVLEHTCAVVGWEPQTGTLSVFCPQKDGIEQISIDELRASFEHLLTT